MKRACFGILLFVMLAGPVAAQDFTAGLIPFQSYSTYDFDSINNNSINLFVHIPVLSYPQRGTLPDLGFYLSYNRITWFQDCVSYYFGIETCWWEPHGGSVRVSPLGESAAYVDEFCDDYGCYYTYYAIDDTGAWHLLTPMGSSSSSPMRATDASGFLYKPTTNAVYDKNGISSILAASADPSGNSISLTTLNGNDAWLDSVGRTIEFPPGMSVPGTCYNDSYNCDIQASPGCTTIDYPGPGGSTSAPYTFCYSNVSVQSDSGFPSPIYGNTLHEWSGNMLMLTSVGLPNGTSWSFTYNSVGGDLASVTLPTGGQVTYTWNRNPCWGTWFDQCVIFTYVNTRSATPDSPGNVKTWSYSASTLGLDLTVTAPDGNNTVYTFGDGGFPATTEFYDSSSTLLKTENRTYFSCCNGMYEVVPKTVTTTWHSGWVSEVCTIYDNNTNTSCGPSDAFDPSGLTDVDGSPIVLGDVIDKYEYDYGNGSPGSLKRKTVTSYKWQDSGSPYLSANTLNLPESVTVSDGSTQAAQTIIRTMNR
jgi:hypothetical protein